MHQHYQNYINHTFRQQSLEQLENLQPADIIPLDNALIPEYYTIVLRLPQEVINRVQKLQQELIGIDGTHYYYPTDQLHITLLGNIDNQVQEASLVSAIGNLDNFDPKFVLYGLGSNIYCSSMSAYPQFDIQQLRTQLRAVIGANTDDYSSHLTSYEQMGWINFLRYCQAPKLQLLKALREKQHEFFGLCLPTSVEIYKSQSKVLSANTSVCIYTRPLKSRSA